MGLEYQTVLWNKQKKNYDKIIVAFVLLYLILFVGITFLVNTETNKLELVITIGQILNLQSLNEEELELMLDEAKVSEEFRLSYPCNFMYMITGIKTIH